MLGHRENNLKFALSQMMSDMGMDRSSMLSQPNELDNSRTIYEFSKQSSGCLKGEDSVDI